jgi:hypothetical protein
VDKSPKQRKVLANEWWPGAGSNGRHADFQGVTRESCNHLTLREVVNSSALPILVLEALAGRINRLHSFWFATANHSSGGAS